MAAIGISKSQLSTCPDPKSHTNPPGSLIKSKYTVRVSEGSCLKRMLIEESWLTEDYTSDPALDTDLLS